jgi:hypothetical protein
MRRIFWVSSTVLLICISASAEVRGAKPQYLLGYTDPGSGALLLQYLTMGGLFLAFYFSRARTWVAKRLGWSQPPSNEESADPQGEKTEGAHVSPPGRAV